MIKSNKLLAFALLILSFQLAGQSLKLPQLFSDHMVMQREVPVRIWGWAEAGQVIQVTIDQVTVSTIADGDGKWECLYPSHVAGGPYTMKVNAGKSIELADLWFGEVWIAGGQSNMGMKLKSDIDNWQAEVADSDYPQIRFFQVPRKIAFQPEDEITGGEWKIASPSNSPDFSAVAWFFAKHNHLDKKVPVGVIESNWGGTPAEAWTSGPVMLSIDNYRDATLEVMDPGKDWESVLAENERKNIKKMELVDRENFANMAVLQHDYDDSGWKTVVLPSAESFEDVVWLRKKIDLKGSTRNLKLAVGNLQHKHKVFVNGKEVKGVPSFDSFKVPNGYFRKGENTIVLRLVNPWGNKLSIRPEEDLWLDNGIEKLSLEGEWKFSNTIEDKIPEVVSYQSQPATLYNGMIHPIEGYTIKGAIWYQGESNTGRWYDYHELFEKMILDWRIRWKQGHFPFLFVQLANYLEMKDDPTDTGWARLREAQTQTLGLPKTGMATIIDIGNAKDIHPRNKQDVGTRLYMSAKKIAYGDEVVFTGPTYRRVDLEGDRIIVTFDHVGSGLISKGPKVVGFAIAGEDRKFYWAEGELSGNKIILKSAAVTRPLYVRYAWADNPACNLYNMEGFPTVPFRTDDFEMD